MTGPGSLDRVFGTVSDAVSATGSGAVFDPVTLETCISCGFCLPACPTYQLTGDEAASPRGRIALMRAIDHGEVDVFDAAAREQASFCLGCRACEPVCPAGVPYGKLIEQLRDAQWTGRHRPWRIIPLMWFAGSRRLIRVVGRMRRHARTARVTPTAPVTPTASAAPPEHPSDTLMLGCFERALFPAVSRAAVATIPSLTVPRDQGCCGALHAHNGDLARGEDLARRLTDRPGRIVSTAGGCAAHLATVVGRAKVVDYSEALLERTPLPDPILIDGRPARIGLQDSCYLRNGMGVTAAPRTVLAALGDYVEVPGAGECCGAAGTYAILRPTDSRKVLAGKITALTVAYLTDQPATLVALVRAAFGIGIINRLALETTSTEGLAVCTIDSPTARRDQDLRA